MMPGLEIILLAAGAVLMAIAALGIVRMPDLLMRMSASTKATTLGVLLTVAGAAVHFGTLAVVARVVAIVVFVGLTGPVAAHLLGRAGYASGAKLWDGTRVDEYRGRSPKE